MSETCSAVLRSRRNCSSDDGAERTDDGRAFHARAAVTGKARSPSVVRRVDGMMVASDNQARNHAHIETDRQTDAPAPNAGDLLSTYMSHHVRPDVIKSPRLLSSFITRFLSPDLDY